MKFEPRSRAVVQATALALLAAGPPVMADSPAATGSASTTKSAPIAAPSFPYVTVVTPTDEQRARWSQDAAPDDGMRAYLDPKTGRLREPTLDDLRRDAAAAQAARESRTAPPATSAAPQILRRPDGTMVARAPANTMVYGVARRADDGSIVSDCAAGPDEAAKLTQSHAPAARRTNGGQADER